MPDRRGGLRGAYQECGRALRASPVLCVEEKLTRMGKLDRSVTAERVIGLGSWRDFDLPPVGNKTLGSAANRNEKVLRQTPQQMMPLRGTHTGDLWSRSVRYPPLSGWKPDLREGWRRQ